ncbi:hypothetical protein B296_00003970 [Ensete ventricosum]|uniref:40S ribosomal protein S3a n=1 Tax=Ensete ventricosum TaxID=4639 RepID=A0A426ZFP5_ENSVE|nr:hypothetical protein B296_00003970 [Ensete ventricosum]
MDLTTDKVRYLVLKWQTLIEAHVDVKITDNYTLRMFCIGFTKRRPNQVHGDYKEDVGVKVDRPAEDVQMEGEEVVGA